MNLNTIEDLAETDLAAALQQLRMLPRNARTCLLEAELLARSGNFADALKMLDQSVAQSMLDSDLECTFESRIMRASVLAATGAYDEAIPKMAQAIRDLEAHPEWSSLQSEARAELRAYQNLVSPKTRATWAAVFCT